MGFSRYSTLMRCLRKATTIKTTCDCQLSGFKKLHQSAVYSSVTQEPKKVFPKVTHFEHHSIDETDSSSQSVDLSLLQLRNASEPFELSNNEEYDDTEYLTDIHEQRPHPLDMCTEDLSHVGPNFPLLFNFAAYANESPMIQRLAELGVDFSRLERRYGLAQFLLPLDFEKDMKLHIRFLNDCGIEPDALGNFLTKNPFIFKESLDDLHTRIRYLRAHKFNQHAISLIMNKNPYWILFNTKRIDARLGHFQNEFQLSGSEVRKLATRGPKLITYNMEHIKKNTFAVREEMGFDKMETKLLLLSAPRLWMKNRECLIERFDYAHNEMKLPHELIVAQPEILNCRLNRIKERHMFLTTQGKAQYDPTKPLYVSMKSLVTKSDAEFSMEVAKAPVEAYNLYLKSL